MLLGAMAIQQGAGVNISVLAELPEPVLVSTSFDERESAT
jgi:hypothetical protein